jgi:phospholipase/carboxylesterase
VHRRAFGIGAAATLFGGSLAWAAAGPQRLDGPRRPPTRSPARFLVVLLHGFGSDGADMAGLAPAFQAYAPTAAFAAPNGPFAVGGGYSWSAPQPQTGNRDADRARRAAAGGGPALDAFIEAELARYGLGPERLILLGFSQGTSVALNTGLRRATPPAAVIAFSGANLAAEGLPRTGRRPPVLLIQGDQDPMVAAGAQQKAMDLLRQIGAPVQAHMLPGLGHGIDERGVRLAGDLLRSVTRE